MNDREMAATLARDEEAWYSLLIDRYTAYVTAIVSGIAKGTLSVGDVEEAVADVFYKVWCRREKLKSDTLKAYIAQIARRTAIDRLRAKGQEFVSYEDDMLQVAVHNQPSELAIAREQKEIVEQAVEHFGEPEREIFIRFYYWGETIKLISEKLRLNPATTKTKLHRSRAKLKEILQERGYGIE